MMFHHAHCLHLKVDGHLLGSLGEGIFLLKRVSNMDSSQAKQELTYVELLRYEPSSGFFIKHFAIISSMMAGKVSPF